jgi:HSP20 family protein
MSERGSILSEIKSMKQRMEILYSENFPDPDGGPDPREAGARWLPSTDIWKRETEWLVIMDLPGVESRDITIEIMGTKLVIGGQRSVSRAEGNDAPVQGERPSGIFRRSVELPRDAGMDGIAAELSKGVLTVTIPRTRGTSQRIKVETE